MDKNIITKIPFSALVLLCVACKGGATKGDIPPLGVDYAVATLSPVQDRIWFASSLEPLESATIEPRVSGYLLSKSFVAGESVKRGERIFTIDPSLLSTSLYTAEATLESARAQLVEARNNFQRAEPLVAINAISQSSYDGYQANYIAAQASVKSAEQSLRNAKLNLSYTTITSPLDGVIADSSATEGDYVGVGTQFSTLTTITQIDTMRLTLPIPTARYLKYHPSDISSSNADLLSDITLILADSTTYPHLAEYDYTQQSASSGNSSVVIVAKLPNPSLSLKSGMFARVRANIGEPHESIVVPQRAVIQLQGVNSVWVISPDSTISYRRVSLGNTSGQMWQIESGLQSGEMVATSGQLKLHQGMKVAPQTLYFKP